MSPKLSNAKDQTTIVDLLSYKIDALEKRINFLEISRESRERELLNVLINILGKDSQQLSSPSLETPTKPLSSQPQSKSQVESSNMDNLISMARRRTIL